MGQRAGREPLVSRAILSVLWSRRPASVAITASRMGLKQDLSITGASCESISSIRNLDLSGRARPGRQDLELEVRDALGKFIAALGHGHARCSGQAPLSRSTGPERTKANRATWETILWPMAAAWTVRPAPARRGEIPSAPARALRTADNRPISPATVGGRAKSHVGSPCQTHTRTLSQTASLARAKCPKASVLPRTRGVRRNRWSQIPCARPGTPTVPANLTETAKVRG